MMNCKKIQKLVTDYFDKSLGRLTKARFELHLRMCPSCQNHVDKMEQLVDALGQLPDDATIPPEMLDHFRTLASQHAEKIKD